MTHKRIRNTEGVEGRFEIQVGKIRTRVPEPVLNAGLKRTRIRGFPDSGYVVSLTIPLPLFNWGQAETARAQAVAKRIQAERLALRQQIEADWGDAGGSEGKSV